MSVINPNETAGTWRAHKRESAVHLYLGGADGDAAALVGSRVAGFPLSLSLIPVEEKIDPEELAGCAAVVVQVDPGASASMKRFEALAASEGQAASRSEMIGDDGSGHAMARSGSFQRMPVADAGA